MRKLVILGLSGSIGKQVVDIIDNHLAQISIEAVSVGNNIDYLDAFLSKYQVKAAYAIKLNSEIKNKYPHVDFYEGDDLLKLLDYPHDLLVNALVGYVGFKPTLKDMQKGIDVALANKESLVVGGKLIKDAQKASGAKLYPIDSEHSAIYQIIKDDKRHIKRLLITASGGAFRDKSRQELLNVTKADALNHPTWSMGSKITIDSATMMNKGFEIIEAHYLFDIPYENIDVILHKQSIIHSMVEFSDGSIIAQLSEPDMRLPINFALFNEHLSYKNVKTIDFSKVLNLSFENIDTNRFPLIKIAKMVGTLEGNMGAILNSANDTAVELFLDEKISFIQIEEIIIEALKNSQYIKDATFEDIENAYNRTREFVLEYIKK